MIQISIKGKIPSLNPDISNAMKQIALYQKKSVQRNFVEGGRPARWVPIKSGESNPLFSSGRLFSSIMETFEETWAEVSAGGNGITYARLHQYGGVLHPKITERSKSFFWKMFYHTGDTMWKALALKNVGSTLTVNIPARPYMVFQPEDITTIKKILLNSIVRITTDNDENISTLQ